MKKLMLVGETSSGKTTLVQSLKNEELEYKKTQALVFHEHILDTPGEYLENRRHYNSLLASSLNYDIIALVQDSSRDKSIYPAKFATMFGKKEVVGIVTKIDKEDADIEKAAEFLKLAGVDKIIYTSSYTREGIDEIYSLIDSDS